MRYFDETLVANSRPHQAWWGEVGMQREVFHQAEDALISNHRGAMAAALGSTMLANSAAVLPRDAWLEMDTITRRVMRDDEGENFMRDLMPLARPVHIGKIAFGYRVASDAGTVRRSISGQVPEVLGKTEYDYKQAIVPIFNTGYGRSWREWNTLQSENFDALADDQESHTAAIRRDMASYVLNGDTSITFQGSVGYGIRNHPNAKAINIGNLSSPAGYNIDLTASATTADAIDAFFTNGIGGALRANKLGGRKVNLYVSPEIMQNFTRSFSGSAGFKPGRIIDYLRTHPSINKIEETSLLSGNEFFAFVADPTYIRPLVGMAVNTTAAVRLNPVDDYNFLIMGALGIDIRADWNGNAGVFYSVVVNN
jgi:hypothetical protein